MQIIDEAVLDQFRGVGRCEICQRPQAVRDPHHVMGKGMGGSSQLDIRINLLAVCRWCHVRIHGGNIKREEVLKIVARREQTTPDLIEKELYRLIRTPKENHERET